MRQPAAEAIVRARAERPFTSVDDLALRVPELRKDEMKMLAEVGALNPLQQIPPIGLPLRPRRRIHAPQRPPPAWQLPSLAAQHQHRPPGPCDVRPRLRPCPGTCGLVLKCSSGLNATNHHPVHPNLRQDKLRPFLRETV